jgi:hypothetical protein
MHTGKAHRAVEDNVCVMNPFAGAKKPIITGSKSASNLTTEA